MKNIKRIELKGVKLNDQNFDTSELKAIKKYLYNKHNQYARVNPDNNNNGIHKDFLVDLLHELNSV